MDITSDFSPIEHLPRLAESLGPRVVCLQKGGVREPNRKNQSLLAQSGLGIHGGSALGREP